MAELRQEIGSKPPFLKSPKSCQPFGSQYLQEHFKPVATYLLQMAVKD